MFKKKRKVSVNLTVSDHKITEHLWQREITERLDNLELELDELQEKVKTYHPEEK